MGRYVQAGKRTKEDGDDEDDGDDGNGKDDEGGESVSGRRVVNFGEGVRRGSMRGGGYGAPQDLN